MNVQTEQTTTCPAWCAWQDCKLGHGFSHGSMDQTVLLSLEPLMTDGGVMVADRLDASLTQDVDDEDAQPIVQLSREGRWVVDLTDAEAGSLALALLKLAAAARGR